MRSGTILSWIALVGVLVLLVSWWVRTPTELDTLDVAVPAADLNGILITGDVGVKVEPVAVSATGSPVLIKSVPTEIYSLHKMPLETSSVTPQSPRIKSDDIFTITAESTESAQDAVLASVLSGWSVSGAVESGASLKIKPKKKESKSSGKKYAYVTLLHGVDETLRYRGFFINALISRKSLTDAGSKADFAILLGFTSSKSKSILTATTASQSSEEKGSLTQASANAADVFQADLELLKKMDISVIYLDRLVRNSNSVKFAEMALLKTAPWKLLKYDRVQFMDGDVMPMQNMDCFFQLNTNTFNTGNASPLNSGWFLAIPNATAYEEMHQMAVTRLSQPWNETAGWGHPIPNGLMLRGWKKQRTVKTWNFNGASLDQGLFIDYFMLQNGGVALVDEGVAKIYGPRYKVVQEINHKDLFAGCRGVEPMRIFAHFTGHKKPWLSNQLQSTKSPSLRKWAELLDALKLPNITSANIHELQLKPPLGYWSPNK
jgi:hypothetical protein